MLANSGEILDAPVKTFFGRQMKNHYPVCPATGFRSECDLRTARTYKYVAPVLVPVIEHGHCAGIATGWQTMVPRRGFGTTINNTRLFSECSSILEAVLPSWVREKRYIKKMRSCDATPCLRSTVHPHQPQQQF